MLNYCPSCGKVCHENQASAATEARRMSLKMHHYIMSYFCRDCKSWHIGHPPKRIIRELHHQSRLKARNIAL